MRNAATWLLENASMPRFMRMNELPHVSASAIKMIQLRRDLPCTGPKIVRSTQCAVHSAAAVTKISVSDIQTADRALRTAPCSLVL